MIDLTYFWVFLTGALLLNVTPGQDMAYTLAASARLGRRGGIAAATGVGAGSLLWSLLTAAGLAAIVAASPYGLMAIRVAGGIYLLVLAARIIAVLDQAVTVPENRGDEAAGVIAAFGSALVINLFNPKVGLFFFAFLPAFVNPEIGPAWLQILCLGAIFSATSVIVLAVVALAGSAARARLAASDRIRMTIGAVTAIAFALIGLRLLLARAL